ncbi:hypothetical protein AB0I81_59880 [Nonomuraea sp. NPDC050404]|uniref:hypothetical protein n=1 Tax=Nonomuraea sp. NPDC050404 TaxID=3155783 RepID=UPI0033D3A563
MLRTPATLAALTTAAALAVSLASPASAATGTLYLNRAEYVDPSGCYTARTADPFVYNRTDQVAVAFLLPNCGGMETGTVWPGDGKEIVGRSVFIP